MSGPKQQDFRAQPVLENSKQAKPQKLAFPESQPAIGFQTLPACSKLSTHLHSPAQSPKILIIKHEQS